MDFGLKQRQRRDVRMQRHYVPESEEANVATLRLNIATFQRVVKTNLHDVGNQRRDIPEKGKNDVATLGSNVATFQRGSNLTSRR